MNHTIENQPAALARREDIVVQEMPDEVLVYDLRQHKAHCLNKAAAFIWDHCDGQTSVAELTEMMSEEFGAPVDKSLVWHAIERLGKVDLLSEKGALPSDVTFRSRRTLLGKLGTAALLVFPVVMSITSPASAAAASVPPECACCTSFGAGSNRSNTCCPVCNSFPGECYGNASCSTGQGQLLATGVGCSACFTGFPSSNGWRVVTTPSASPCSGSCP